MNEPTKPPAILILAVIAIAVFAGIQNGQINLPGEQGEQPASRFSKSELCRALAETVEANRVEDTDRLLSIADNVGSRHGLDVKSELESKCGIQPGKPKALIADPEFAKQVAEQLRQLGGGL